MFYAVASSHAYSEASLNIQEECLVLHFFPVNIFYSSISKSKQKERGWGQGIIILACDH